MNRGESLMAFCTLMPLTPNIQQHLAQRTTFREECKGLLIIAYSCPSIKVFIISLPSGLEAGKYATRYL